jgi:hypothetical protein
MSLDIPFYRTFPVNAVISMGRRNTKLEPACIENKSQNRSLRLDQPERCPGWVLAKYAQTDRSPTQALSNQCTGWCCIDRLSWQRLSGPRCDSWEIPLPKVISKHCATRQKLFPTSPFLANFRAADHPFVSGPVNSQNEKSSKEHPSNQVRVRLIPSRGFATGPFGTEMI